jgi:hypothetical protein
MEASEFLRLMPDNWFDNILFSDEKWWLKNKAPNRQNYRVYAPKGADPEEVLDCRDQGQEKLMCWAGVVKERILEIHWFVDENDRPINQTAAVYAEMIINPVWNEILRFRNGVWWQQDGARTHTSNANGKFSGDSMETASFPIVRTSSGHPTAQT